MLIQKKFKRLKVNAGFTHGVHGSLCIKLSEKEYRDTGEVNVAPPVFRANPNQLVWVDSFQVKPWWKM